ncbi:Methyltransferase-like protein 17, mitochondrial [Allomyces javanicus]|nr:Methyltransferase-like protein 17, mitochondrial [Allomyces javanicus]
MDGQSATINDPHRRGSRRRDPKLVPFGSTKIDKDPHRHKSGMTVLPAALHDAVDAVLQGTPGADIRRHALRIFDSLRSTSGILDGKNAPTLHSLLHPEQVLTQHHLAYDANLARAYLVSRMPHNFVAVDRALRELFKIRPDFIPASALDLGTGPGTAIWALRDTTAGAATHVTAVDVNASMLGVAAEVGKAAKWHENVVFSEFMPANPNAAFDLTMTAYLLSEVEDPKMRANLIKTMWDLTGDTLVVVDRGTPLGFQRIVEVRDWVIKQGNGTVLAPCPHMNTCPLANDKTRDWCHFAQRMQLPHKTQLVRKTPTNIDDVKFSYLILRKTLSTDSSSTAPSPHPRVLSPPMKRGGHVLLDVCAPTGQAARLVVPKSMGKDIYKDARKVGWGDQWPHGAKVSVPNRGAGRFADVAEFTDVAVKKEKKVKKPKKPKTERVTVEEGDASRGEPDLASLFESMVPRPGRVVDARPPSAADAGKAHDAPTARNGAPEGSPPAAPSPPPTSRSGRRSPRRKLFTQ